MRSTFKRSASPQAMRELACARHSARLRTRNAALCRWQPQLQENVLSTSSTRQALPMAWDFAEAVPISESTGSFERADRSSRAGHCRVSRARHGVTVRPGRSSPTRRSIRCPMRRRQSGSPIRPTTTRFRTPTSPTSSSSGSSVRLPDHPSAARSLRSSESAHAEAARGGAGRDQDATMAGRRTARSSRRRWPGRSPRGGASCATTASAASSLPTRRPRAGRRCSRA